MRWLGQAFWGIASSGSGEVLVVGCCNLEDSSVSWRGKSVSWDGCNTGMDKIRVRHTEGQQFGRKCRKSQVRTKGGAEGTAPQRAAPEGCLVGSLFLESRRSSRRLGEVLTR